MDCAIGRNSCLRAGLAQRQKVGWNAASCHAATMDRPAPPQLPHMDHALTRWHLGHLKLLRSGLGFSAGRRCASSAPSSCKARGKQKKKSFQACWGLACIPHPASSQVVTNRHREKAGTAPKALQPHLACPRHAACREQRHARLPGPKAGAIHRHGHPCRSKSRRRGVVVRRHGCTTTAAAPAATPAPAATASATPAPGYRLPRLTLLHARAILWREGCVAGGLRV